MTPIAPTSCSRNCLRCVSSDMPIRMTPIGAVAPSPAAPAPLSAGSLGGMRVDAFGLPTGATSSM